MVKPVILIMCTGNACRSPMAQAFLQAAAGDAVEVVSAGSNPAGRPHRMTIEVMAEKGLDLRRANSRHVNEFLDREINVVITVCSHAAQVCPVFPGQVKLYHWPFKDPVTVVGTEEMIRKAFRRSRDELEVVFTAYGRGLVDGLELAAIGLPFSG